MELEAGGVGSSGRAALDCCTKKLGTPDCSAESGKGSKQGRDLLISEHRKYNITKIFSVHLKLKFFLH